VALLVGAALLLGLAQTSAGTDALGSLGLRSEAAGFTELAFKASGSLPKHVDSPTDQPRIPFIVGNQEGSARTYAWTVEQRIAGGGAVELAHGTTRKLENASSIAITPDVTVRCTAQRVRVVVKLADPAQSIAFWTRCGTGAA
jgi:hypothetical protein